MKLNKKKAIILTAILLAVIAAAALLVQPARLVLAMASMRPADTQQAGDVFIIKTGFVNLYLMKGGSRYYAFDAGSDAKATKEALEAFGIAPEDINQVYLTHTDYDHVAAVPLFSSAEIVMAETNTTFLEEDPNRSAAFLAMDRPYFALPAISRPGNFVRCIPTPGHTPGSACYVVDGRYLFSGDSFSLKNGKVALFNDVFNMDTEQQAQSIRDLAKLEGIEAIFTAHYGYTSDFEGAFADWQ